MKKLQPPRSVRRLFPNVNLLVDAKRPILVNVTAADNKTGRKKYATDCAMAKAVCRQFKASGAVIGLSTSYVIKGNKAIRFTTPDTVAREITSFDRHQDFAPGEYRLSPVSPTDRIGRKSGAKKKQTTKHAPKRRVHKETVRVRSLITKGGTED